jgi:hypothetical protein
MDEQLAKLKAGELDLRAMVIDEDAGRLTEAVRDRKLQLLDLPTVTVYSVVQLARRIPV